MYYTYPHLSVLTLVMSTNIARNKQHTTQQCSCCSFVYTTNATFAIQLLCAVNWPGILCSAAWLLYLNQVITQTWEVQMCWAQKLNLMNCLKWWLSFSIMKTRSSATADGPHNPLSVKILSTVETCTTYPQQIKVKELECYRWLTCSSFRECFFHRRLQPVNCAIVSCVELL